VEAGGRAVQGLHRHPQAEHVPVAAHHGDWPYGDRLEVQIRTEDMHRIAEEGIAAHWAYKEGKSGQNKDDAKFAWLRQLMEWQQDLKTRRSSSRPSRSISSPTRSSSSPQGRRQEPARGATPVDFAFAIHSDVGNKCVGAKVNGKIVPLRYKLKNGDTVEVLTSGNAHPSKDWLTYVKTSRAQAKIRAYIKASSARRAWSWGAS